MNSLRYIHAADLHLDTPFLGLSRTDAGEALQAQLRDATFTALQRLFDQCERLRPDFLVLAGDIYNQEEHSVKAQPGRAQRQSPAGPARRLCAPAGLRHPGLLGPRQP